MAFHSRNVSDRALKPGSAVGRPSLPAANLWHRSAIAAFAVVAVAAAGLLIGVAAGVHGHDLVMLFLALFTFIVACVPLVLDQGRPIWERHLFISVVALIFMSHYVLPAFMIYIPASGPVDASSTYNTNLMPPHVTRGQLMAFVGLVSMLVAYALPFGKLVARAFPEPRYDWRPPVLLGLALVMITVGWSVMMASAFGLIPGRAGTGVRGVIASSCIYANVFLVYAYLRHRLRVAIPIMLVNVGFLFLFGVFTSRKLHMLIAPGVVALTSIVLGGRIRIRWVVLGFLAIMLVYPVSVMVRRDILPHSSVAALLSDPGYVLGEVSTFIAEGRMGRYLRVGFEATVHRMDGLGITSVIVRDTPGVSPFQHGRTLLLFFVAFVPRVFWPAKPDIHIGQWITDVYGTGSHVQMNCAPTPIGEFYLNFGVPGIVGGMMVFGVMLRLMHELVGRARFTAPTVMAQVIVLMTLGVQFAGAVAGVYSNLALLLVPIVFVHKAIRRFSGAIPAPSRREMAMASRRGAKIAPGSRW